MPGRLAVRNAQKSAGQFDPPMAERVNKAHTALDILRFAALLFNQIDIFMFNNSIGFIKQSE